MKYQTIQGHEFDVDDSPPGTIEFLSSVILLAGRGASEDELVELIYSDQNPTLGPYPFGGRGAVTRETLENPAYWAMGDLLFRARLARRGVSTEQAAERYTLLVSEAAKRLGVSRAAVQKAIQTRRLESWVKDERHYLCADDVDRWASSLTETRRGFSPEAPEAVGAPLAARLGGVPGVTFKLKVSEQFLATERESGHVFVGTIRAGWKLLAVSYSDRDGDEGEQRRTVLVLVPGDTDNAIEHHGFYLRGRFKVLHKRTGERASRAWQEFQPEP